MNVDSGIRTSRADRPLTRADIEQRIQEAGGSNRLDVRGQNLHEIDLHMVDLRGANLSRANLNEAIASGTYMNANNRDYLLKAIGVRWDIQQEVPSGVSSQEESNTSIFTIRIVEEPLSAQNATAILATFTDLHTR